MLGVICHDLNQIYFFFQAVEFLAEWSLTPSNEVFLRVHNGIYDPSQIGDKAKWFASNLECVKFSVWDDASSLGGVLKHMPQQEQPTGKCQFWSKFT